MNTMASQITSLTIVYSVVYSDADQRKHQSSASLAFVQWIHRGPVNSPHKWPVTQKMFPFDDVIMEKEVKKLTWLTGSWALIYITKRDAPLEADESYEPKNVVSVYSRESKINNSLMSYYIVDFFSPDIFWNFLNMVSDTLISNSNSNHAP